MAKVGLVLGGGGARGAYQLGVFFALYKYGLYRHIKAISGASIGSLMALAFLDGDLIKTYRVWRYISNDIVLTLKDNYRSRVPVKGRGIFSTQGLKEIMLCNYNLEELVETKKPIYFASSKIKKKKLKKEYEAKYFLVNYKSEMELVQYLTASSAIPYIFDRVKIDYDLYTDALKSDSVPVTPLLQYKLDWIFVIPLSSSHSIERFKSLSIPVVDFMDENLLNSPTINMIDFNQEKIDEYISLGYYVADTLLKELFKRKVFSKRILNQKYFSLKSLGIKIDIKRKLTLEEILKDAKYRRKKI